MTVYRKARPDEQAKCAAFGNMVFFSGDDQRRFETLLPKVYGADVDPEFFASMHNIAVREDGEIVGLVAALPMIMHAGGDTLKTAFIGTVSVHPEARGEGHMKALMSRTIEDLKQNGTDIAFLSGQRQRYEHFGFSSAGEVYELYYCPASVRHAYRELDASKIVFRPITDAADSALDWIARMREKDVVWYERPRAALLACCQSYSQILYAIEDGGALIGWLTAEPKNDAIRELKLEDEGDFDRVIKAWVEQYKPESVCVDAAPWEKKRLRSAGLYADEIHLNTHLMCRVLHPERVIPVLLRLKNGYSEISGGALTLNTEGKAWRFEWNDGTVSVSECAFDAEKALDATSLARLLGYPFDFEGRSHAPRGWLPLPIYCGTTDAF